MQMHKQGTVTIFQHKLQYFAEPFIFQVSINDTTFSIHENNSLILL